MNEYRIVPDVDFNDDYKNAKKDLLEAMNSISKLTPLQKRFLAEELFGAANVEMLLRIISNRIIWGEKWQLAIRNCLKC